jgi:hypothetical protein
VRLSVAGAAVPEGATGQHALTDAFGGLECPVVGGRLARTARADRRSRETSGRLGAGSASGAQARRWRMMFVSVSTTVIVRAWRSWTPSAGGATLNPALGRLQRGVVPGARRLEEPGARDDQAAERELLDEPELRAPRGGRGELARPHRADADDQHAESQVQPFRAPRARPRSAHGERRGVRPRLGWCASSPRLARQR